MADTPHPKRTLHFILRDKPLCGAKAPFDGWLWPHWPTGKLSRAIWKDETCEACWLANRATDKQRAKDR